jgi:predicted type IV restriction endonuclease
MTEEGSILKICRYANELPSCLLFEFDMRWSRDSAPTTTLTLEAQEATTLNQDKQQEGQRAVLQGYTLNLATRRARVNKSTTTNRRQWKDGNTGRPP